LSDIKVKKTRFTLSLFSLSIVFSERAERGKNAKTLKVKNAIQ
jgi:hypothetical protein